MEDLSDYANVTYDESSIHMSVSYEELGKSDKKLEKVGTIGKKSFI